MRAFSIRVLTSVSYSFNLQLKGPHIGLTERAIMNGALPHPDPSSMGVARDSPWRGGIRDTGYTQNSQNFKLKRVATLTVRIAAMA